MSDDCLHAAKMHLSEAADLAGTLASGFAMKKLTRALNRCNPISVNPHSPQGYAENPFEGGNVGQPAQNPQYSVGSYPEGRAIEANFAQPPQPYDHLAPVPAIEYPGNTIPPAIVPDVMQDPCRGMKEMLASCAPPSQYCPSFMGQPTGEIPPLAGTPQPVDLYTTLSKMATSQEQYAQGHKPKGPGGGQFTSGDGDSGKSQKSTTSSEGPKINAKMRQKELHQNIKEHQTRELGTLLQTIASGAQIPAQLANSVLWEAWNAGLITQYVDKRGNVGPYELTDVGHQAAAAFTSQNVGGLQGFLRKVRRSTGRTKGQ